MEFTNFIVLDSFPGRKKQQIATVNGMVVTVLEKPVPVIVRGEGCIGLGIVKQLDIRFTATDIYFELYRDIDDQKKDFLYNLYRDQVSVGGSGQDYNTDAVIPGAINSLKSSSSRSRSAYQDNTPKRRSSGRRSITDDLDEDIFPW